MTSTEFYRHILGLESPWSVSKVDLDMTANRVVVRVEIDRTTKWFHPETQEPATLHKWTERKWRHLDTCQFETIIEANVPSVKYRDGKIEEVAVPWADRYQRFTKLMEQAVIIWLRACGIVDKVAATMRLDWQMVLLNYLKHRITNAASEGMNSLVACVIANARSLRTFRTLRVRGLFFLGKLDLTV